MKEKEVIICITGHSPQKLWGYKLSDPKYIRLKEMYKEMLLQHKCTEAVSGVALGADMLFALAVLELKEEGHKIKLHCAIPCKDYPSRWPDASASIYKNILSSADKITHVSYKPYTLSLIQKRNEFMVDYANIVFAVWDGSKGITKTCMDYAKAKKKELITISPEDISGAISTIHPQAPEYTLIKAINAVIEDCKINGSGTLIQENDKGWKTLWLEANWVRHWDRKHDVIELLFRVPDSGQEAYRTIIPETSKDVNVSNKTRDSH